MPPSSKVLPPTLSIKQNSQFFPTPSFTITFTSLWTLSWVDGPHPLRKSSLFATVPPQHRHLSLLPSLSIILNLCSLPSSRLPPLPGAIKGRRCLSSATCPLTACLLARLPTSFPVFLVVTPASRRAAPDYTVRRKDTYPTNRTEAEKCRTVRKGEWKLRGYWHQRSPAGNTLFHAVLLGNEIILCPLLLWWYWWSVYLVFMLYFIYIFLCFFLSSKFLYEHEPRYQ